MFLLYEISEPDRRAGIAELIDLLECGRLIHTVARRLPLTEIAEAHELSELGELIGNIVLDVSWP